MGFNIKTWSNPVNLDANNLNRIEQGIKNSHDTLEIVSEEVSNLQHKQLDLETELNNITKNTPDILNTLDQLNVLLQNNDISAIFEGADSFLMKKEQTLTTKELNQVYKNLGLSKFVSYNSILIDGELVVPGQTIEINSTKVDQSLNKNSSNAISNKTVTIALKELEDKLSNTSSGTNTEIDYSTIQQYLKNKTTVIIRRWI